tara:strand:+ start:4711 stop:5100 length:390 start_codon:yes stop_codon:yes gene_type:complete
MAYYDSLIGLEWEYGKVDCYSLMRNYFKSLGVELPDYVRPENLETCESVFLNQLPKKGFVQISIHNRQPHDVLVMRLGTKTAMHAAILLPHEKILHQKQESLSCIEPFNSYYVKRTEAVFRYAANNTPR